MNLYPKTFTATDLKNSPSEILNLVAYGNYEVMIEKHGVEIAKVVPVSKTNPKKDYRKIMAKYFGSTPDFPEVYKYRSKSRNVEVFN
jgi:prevent-host-death family protein